jgi:hypothetical protein
MLLLNRPGTRKIPVNRGVPFQLGQLILRRTVSRFDCRKDRAATNSPNKIRRDHQRERENPRGHSAP